MSNTQKPGVAKRADKLQCGECDNYTFLTVKEAAVILNVSPMFVHRVIADGQLPVHRFGRAVRIKACTLFAFADAAADTPVKGRSDD